MSGSAREVAAEVWVLSVPRPRWAESAAHPADLASARVMAPRRRAEFLAGRAALRQLLRTVRPGLADAAVRADPRGRPGLAGHPEVGISVSHDGDTFAVAVAPGRRVGVDVQLPPVEPSDNLLRRCLRERADQLAALPPAGRGGELAWVWTVQEACVKATGEGLAGRPWSIDVPLGRRRGRWGPYAWVSLRDHSPIPLSCAFTDPPADLE